MAINGTSQIVNTPRRHFRNRIFVYTCLYGAAVIWLIFFALYLIDQNNFNEDFFINVDQQVQSQTIRLTEEFLPSIRAVQENTITLSEYIDQNPASIAEETRIRDAIPPSIQIYMVEEDEFRAVQASLREIIEEVDVPQPLIRPGLVDKNYIYSLRVHSVYIIERASEIARPHLARVVVSSSVEDRQTSGRLWPGKYIRGSNRVQYDALFRGREISGDDYERSNIYFKGVPLYTPTRAINSAIIFEYDISDNLLEFNARINRRAIAFAVATIILWGLNILVLFAMLSPITKLRHNARLLRQGDFSSRVYFKAHDELEFIADSTNFIAEKLHDTDKEIRRVDKINKSFIPQQFLHYLNKDSLTHFVIGEYVERYINIISIHIAYPHAYEKKHLAPREIIDTISDNVAYIGSIVDKELGFIHDVSEDSISILYPGSSDDAIATAIDIQRKFSEYSKKRTDNNKREITFHIGMHRGTAAVGMIGYEGYIRPTVISSAVNIAHDIAETAARIGAQLIISNILNENIQNTTSFQTRYLGNMTFGVTSAIQMYDVIDAYDARTIRSIMNTRIDFAEAVHHFETGGHQKALNTLATLLAAHQDDRVAQYFYQYLQEKYEQKKVST